jgi:hypothetical protein
MLENGLQKFFKINELRRTQTKTDLARETENERDKEMRTKYEGR